VDWNGSSSFAGILFSPCCFFYPPSSLFSSSLHSVFFLLSSSLSASLGQIWNIEEERLLVVLMAVATNACRGIHFRGIPLGSRKVDSRVSRGKEKGNFGVEMELHNCPFFKAFNSFTPHFPIFFFLVGLLNAQIYMKEGFGS
jgi:hypothetical protein